MKNIKSHIKMALGILLALAVVLAGIPVTQAQAASKKVTAAKYKENKEDYPDVTTGSYRIKVKSETWNGTDGCVKFEAKKAGTYTFKLKDSTSTRLTSLQFWKNHLPHSDEADKAITTESVVYDKENNSSNLSVKFKLKKGDVVYISMYMAGSSDYMDGKLTLSIKKK